MYDDEKCFRILVISSHSLDVTLHEINLKGARYEC